MKQSGINVIRKPAAELQVFCLHLPGVSYRDDLNIAFVGQNTWSSHV